MVNFIKDRRRNKGNYYIDEEKIGYVYLMDNGRKDSSYKIGFTTQDPEDRLKQGKTFNPEISLVCYYGTDNYTGEEKYWHRRFKKQHDSNEWFLLKPKHLKEFIARAKTYDICYDNSGISISPEEPSERLKNFLITRVVGGTVWIIRIIFGFFVLGMIIYGLLELSGVI